MAGQGIELTVELLPDDAWIHVEGTQPRDYARLAALATRPRAFSLRLRVPDGSVNWRPDAVECPAAGRVFAEVLKQLYDGNQWRMNLPLNTAHMMFQIVPLVGDDMSRWGEGLSRYASAHGLSHAFQTLRPNPDDHDDPYCMDYWWCPKKALSAVLADAWSSPTSGYVAPWPEGGALEAAIRSGEGLEAVERLISLCRFAFQWVADGETMVLLSRQLGYDEVTDALRCSPVQRALGSLNEKALLLDWVARREVIGGRVCTIYEKPRPGGAGVRRVHLADDERVQ
jgi:hypothetical protein